MTRLDDLLTQSQTIRANLAITERKLRDSLAAVIDMQEQLTRADGALHLALALEAELRAEGTHGE